MHTKMKPALQEAKAEANVNANYEAKDEATKVVFKARNKNDQTIEWGCM